MASSNKVFVSPGVYTSERDLSFVAQSVGITTLGIVGESQKGPAFEPVFVSSYDEFTTYFGGTLPEKFYNTQIPKYEAAYIAKSYLQQSNQMFMTRVLGLSGYDAGPSWSITTVANPDKQTIQISSDLNSFGSSMSFSGNTNYPASTIQVTSPFGQFSSVFTETYTKFDGSTSSIKADVQEMISSIFANPTSLSASTAYQWGTVGDGVWQNLTLFASYNLTNVLGVSGQYDSVADYTAAENDPWYYLLFNNTTGNTYTGTSFVLLISNVSSFNSGGTGNYGGTLTGYFSNFGGTAYSGYNNLVVATLRSRGIATYTNDTGPVYQVSGTSNVVLDFSGSYSATSENPFSQFRVSGVTIDNENFTFETSMTLSDSNYISKVFGTDNFGKNRTEVPLFVEENYHTLLSYGYNKGYIRGLRSTLVSLPSARSNSANSIGYYLDEYQSAHSPYLVSELRGNKVYRLFRFITISDGNAANSEVKVSIANISFSNGTFDVIVRDFFDTDASPVVLEKFTNCSMDPGQNSFIGVKIGTPDGEYQVNSKYIMVEISEEAPIDALPCGFEGYVMRQYGSATPPLPVYKTKYDFPGEVVYDPPFGLSSGNNNSTVSSGDNVRRTYLGFSTELGNDPDLFSYKGKQNPASLPATSAEDWAYETKGFHMDSGATVVTISGVYTSSGQTAFEVGSAEFRSEPTSQDNPYYRLFARKFTVLVQGGFDGWDVYREYRSNGDRFLLGSAGYLKGAAPSVKYPNATGSGLFKQITVGDNTQDWANTDYYAYLLGIYTFSNPEAVNINVFATASIDYVNNSNLVEATVDMVENSRADSIYITTTPDYNMFVSTTSFSSDFIYTQEAVDNLETSGLDSNYTATYYPWILTRDTVNNTQIYLPATGEVCRNLALTDNISFPWFASAGYTRGLVNSIKARRKLTQEDRDTLYKGRINPIATFSDVGTVIWGNKTLQIAESALDRLNVRRLLLQARKLISAVSVRLLFEQNDDVVRQQFLDSVNPILDAIRRDRGLYDFRVTVSSSPEDLDRNQLVGKIYIKPTKALEFIDIEFLITPTGASFENI